LAILTKRIWKTLRKQYLPQTVFFVITIVSASLLILPLWNYVGFYAALYNFDYSPTITINTSQLDANTAQINVTLVTSNPMGYSGLRATEVTCMLEYTGEAHEVLTGVPPRYQLSYLWDLTTVGSASTQYTISPNTNTTILFQTTINPISVTGDQQTAYYDFIGYLRTQVATHGQIQWFLTCRLTLISFIGPVNENQNFNPVTTLS
jgi:hypothetical protein